MIGKNDGLLLECHNYLRYIKYLYTWEYDIQSE